ncbi:hypothetical protein FRB93_008047 [Tulasnella sp. JGI-2019a]|nr:hypothetical protein FRB93_008047 [Tulasnella sp. JGI-2019a]
MFSRHMPRLRHLRLSNITVSRDSDVLSDLDTLSLATDAWRTGLSTEQVIAILRASPSSTSFRLRCHDPPSAYSPAIVSLPRLHTLDLNLPVWKAEQLFTCLGIPHCMRFNFHFVTDGSDEFYGIGSKILSSILTSTMAIHLDIFPTNMKFKWRRTSEDGSWPFEATINWSPPKEDLHLHLFSKLPIVHLAIDDAKTRLIRPMTAFLLTLSSVTSLTFKSPHPRQLILDLSVPQSSSPKGWLLPRLQSLEISVAPTDRDLLLGMVQARHDGVDLDKIVEGGGALPLRPKGVAVTSYGWKDADLRYLREKVAGIDWSIVT